MDYTYQKFLSKGEVSKTQSRNVVIHLKGQHSRLLNVKLGIIRYVLKY